MKCRLRRTLEIEVISHPDPSERNHNKVGLGTSFVHSLGRNLFISHNCRSSLVINNFTMTRNYDAFPWVDIHNCVTQILGRWLHRGRCLSSIWLLNFRVGLRQLQCKWQANMSVLGMTVNCIQSLSRAWWRIYQDSTCSWLELIIVAQTILRLCQLRQH